MTASAGRAWLCAALLALVASTPCAAQDALSAMRLSTTTGAAADFVPDAACGRCHQQIAASFAEVGMARSLSRGADGPASRPFEGSRHRHQASAQDFALERRDGGLWYVQSGKSADGDTHKLELRVDWIIGSGNRVQSFLHQTKSGELYQLPVSWYTQSNSLRMSPGYEAANHPGVERRVRRECLFCHNAYPEVAVGSDLPGQPDLFPLALPEGIGCQRCHGPGASHLRAILDGKELAQIRAAITNPARLPWPARNDVCFQCHLLPAVEVIGSRRIGRGDYSFRPGQRLSDYLVHVDIDDSRQPRDERFQINHHGWRLLQSRCYQESDGGMGCVSCHDPHVRRVGPSAVGWYRDKCLSCHQTLDIRHGLADGENGAGSDTRNCVQCHMPTRRTQDVIEVTMTDHRITRGPFDAAALVAPLAPRQPQIRDLQLFGVDPNMELAEAGAYRALIALNNGIGGRSAAAALARRLAEFRPEASSWWLQLARHQVGQRQYAEAEQALAELAVKDRKLPELAHLEAMISAGKGDSDAALEQLRQLAKCEDFHPEVDFNLAIIERGQGHHSREIAALKRFLAARPLSAMGWWQLARSYRLSDRPELAAQALLQAQAIKPDIGDSRRDSKRTEEERAGPSAGQ
ncbi:MAG: hypothetical protein H7A19_09810 [Rhodanobacteraceae bacterium]|nr:hypothetical protein [Rhodanobacteraceae bacterium]